MHNPIPEADEALAKVPLAQLERTAEAAFQQGDLALAERAYRHLVDAQKERLDLAANLGYLDLLAGDADAAAARLSAVLERGMRSRRILSHLAEAYYRKGDLGHAAFCYQQLGRDGLAGTLAVMANLDILRVGQAAPTELAWVTTEPLPMVRARVNGKAANLILDTGAGDCVLDARFAVQAGVRLGGHEWRDFAGGHRAEVTHAHLERLDLGDASIHDLPVQVLDLQATLGDWFPDRAVDGIVGSRVLSLFDCVLDYAAGSLLLRPPQAVAQPAGGVPFWLAENWMLLTQAGFPGRSQALVFLDSGMTGGAFAVPEALAGELQVEASVASTLIGTGGAGHVHGEPGVVDRLGIDRLQRRQVQGLLLPTLSIETALGFRIHGLIGHDMLRGVRLALDFTHRRLRVAPTAA